MGVFYHEDHQTNQPQPQPQPQPHSKRCKYIVATLKDLFSLCQTFGGRFSASSSLDEDYPMTDFEQELQVVVSAVISGVMEKQKQKPISVLRQSSFSWVYSPVTKQLYFTKEMEPREKVFLHGQEEEEEEEFYSVKSCLSCGSSSGEAFYSVKTNLQVSGCSSSSSLRELDLSKLYWKRSVLQELCHCEGWPFGLCRRAVLLPPLPNSPSESWLSRKLRTTTKKLSPSN